MPDRALFNASLYWLGRTLFLVSFKLVWRLKVVGRHNIPRTGSLIFASNHISLADPPVIGASIPRMIHFMAKQELFEIPVFGWLIRKVNAFPVRRVERDISAFKTAQRILNSGDALIVFPEGTRQKSGELGRAKAGVGMLAQKTNSRVVPVFVHNTNRLSSLQRIRVCFGEPLSPDADTDYQTFSNRVMQAIAQLKETCLGS